MQHAPPGFPNNLYIKTCILRVSLRLLTSGKNARNIDAYNIWTTDENMSTSKHIPSSILDTTRANY